jgi:calpain-15
MSNTTIFSFTQTITSFDKSNKEQVENEQKSSKWVCNTCTYLNNSSNEERCWLCSTAKPKSKPSETWTCSICSHKNKSHKSKCPVCLNEKDNSSGCNKEDKEEEEAAAIANLGSKSSSASSSAVFRSQKAKSIIKTYANATTQAERVWNNIVNYCKEHGHKFVDDSFPPCDKSLFVDPDGKKPESLMMRGGVQWLSPENIRVHQNDSQHKWTVYNEPKFSDIKQGLLGNCWLLSGLAVIIEKPEMLRRIIITKEFCPQGCYQVRLCLNGEWQTVIVDDLYVHFLVSFL